jgi:hypothetical protein
MDDQNALASAFFYACSQCTLLHTLQWDYRTGINYIRIVTFETTQKLLLKKGVKNPACENCIILLYSGVFRSYKNSTLLHLVCLPKRGVLLEIFYR